MIICATGHEALNQYVVSHTRELVETVSQWGDVQERLPTAHKILLGHSVVAGGSWAHLAEVIRKNVQVEWVLWGPQGFIQDLPDNILGEVTVWEGEIDEETIEQWLRPLPRHITLARRFALITVYPYPSRIDAIKKLTHIARKAHGAGGWVDGDWHQAALTTLQADHLHQRAVFGFERLRSHKTSVGWIIPAPPPWDVIVHWPTTENLYEVLSQSDGWQGWDLGADLRTPLATAILPKISECIVLGQADTPPMVMERVLGIVRLHQPTVPIGIVSPDIKLPPRLLRILTAYKARLLEEDAREDRGSSTPWWKPRSMSRKAENSSVNQSSARPR